MTIAMKIKNYFEDWSKFEISWLVISTVVMIGLSVAWGDNLMALISGITGVIGVVLCAKGKISTYFFATINVTLYAYICWGNNLYGEVMLNSLYFLPMNVVGFLLWRKNKGDSGDIICRKLTPKQIGMMISGLTIAVFIYWKFLVYLGGNLALIDAMTTIVSVVALILQVTRYAEQWLLWIVVNITSIIMWILLLGSDTSAVTMVVMWGAYLLNSIYGYYNWVKLSKEEAIA
ncbi:nicotinamide riboside transporter PnuC [Natronincola ferrireducens]|uniref:Nicotinamide mononucleotide transporter n=1 Tax=Natronincola ferrireducens TaxID=393762 RepID=A0A1G9EZ19_9FIRM|nr:nicotinamide riboside transporter PnuC [Natronincola ferrireducens]SDK81414.1 nicotinamide mononucleotide transporter [Natronincola ferrireducens]